MGRRREPPDALNFLPTLLWAWRALSRYVLPAVGVVFLAFLARLEKLDPDDVTRTAAWRSMCGCTLMVSLATVARRLEHATSAPGTAQRVRAEPVLPNGAPRSEMNKVRSSLTRRPWRQATSMMV
jgi:hypothetical protein